MNKYALLGEKLGHSYSPLIHNKLFEIKGINARYDLLEIKKEDLLNTLEKLRTNEYKGFNVTIPYKIEVMKYLDIISEEAKMIGSVNTIRCINNKLIGFNTDYYGFYTELVFYKLNVKRKKCYVLGTGGSSKTISKVLKDLKAKVINVSRTKAKNLIDYNDLKKVKKIDILINTTPVGMYPNVDISPVSKEIIDKASIVVDIIYNPQKTMLMSMAKESYNGLLMLIAQANRAQELWLDKEIEIDYDMMIDYISEVMK